MYLPSFVVLLLAIYNYIQLSTSPNLQRHLNYNIGLRLSYSMQGGNQIIITQLVSLFNHLFDKQNLRKNVYLFNATNHNMTLSLKTILKERKVAAITNSTGLIVTALKKCPLVQVISDNTIKILMKGDDVVVRLKSTEGKNIAKKDITHLTRQMRCESRQQKNGWVLQFQSHAAAVEFMQRVKMQEKGYITELMSNDPYEYLSKSINNLRKQKKTQNTYVTAEEAYPASYYNYNYMSYLPQYAPFVRKAVDSDEEDNASKPTKKQNQKEVKPVQNKLDQQDFPSFDEVREAIKEVK